MMSVNHPRRRAIDSIPIENESMMSAFWRRYAPYWHICVAILWFAVFSVIWYQTVNAAVAQTGKNTSDISTLQLDVAVMGQKIDDIHGWLKAEHDKNQR